MPFYEYECSACGHQAEVLQKISDAPLRKCPDCGKSTLKKLVSAPVFRLKGSGWYETDFKSDKEEKRNLAKDDAPVESKSEAKADSAPAAGEAKTDNTAKAETKKTVVAKPVPKPVKATSRPAKKVAKPAKSAKKKARR